MIVINNRNADNITAIIEVANATLSMLGFFIVLPLSSELLCNFMFGMRIIYHAYRTMSIHFCSVCELFLFTILFAYGIVLYRKRGEIMNERMKELRKAMGKSQEEFGKILGITKSGVSDIESGRRNVTEQHIIMLRNENVNEEWLRTGNGEMFIPETKDEQITNMLADVLKSEDSDFKKRLIVALSKMDDTGWGALEKFIDSIAEQKKE
nr:MAG TPA: Helix-turn-helix XRE-family like protein [Bacteriophage sp.]